MTHAQRHAAFLVSASVLLAFNMVEPAAAQSLGGVEKVLQNIVDALTGNVAKLLATIAVIVVGMAWMFGYLDPRRLSARMPIRSAPVPHPVRLDRNARTPSECRSVGRRVVHAASAGAPLPRRGARAWLTDALCA